MNGVVIVGGGQAAVQLADSLRSEGYAGPVTIFADEAHLPYQRPPLSKDFMSEHANATPLPLRGPNFFRDSGITLHAGTRVTQIDRTKRTVASDDGTTHGYATLVLATGTRNRLLSIDGADLHGVHYLRTLDDALVLQTALASARRIVVVGAGFIGLEFAAAARQRGLEVTVLEFASRPMSRVLTQPTADYFTHAHTHDGINLKLGEGIAALKGQDGRIVAAVGTSGIEYPADIVLVGVGVIPNDDLAQHSGLSVNNGIVVDSYLQTNDPHIYALGDCCSYPSKATGAMTRLESVQNATDQAKSLAKTLTGKPTSYERLPWFWSQQGRIKLQIAGIASNEDETVMRGDPPSGKFSVYCFRAGRLVGVESVNSPADHANARRLLENGYALSPEQAGDLNFDIKAHSQGRLSIVSPI